LQVGQIAFILFIGLFVGAAIMFYMNKAEIESLEKEIDNLTESKQNK